MLSTCLANLHEKSPLVHSITNFVTVNDCANLLLACGARPIMASDPQEAAEITAAADALNINIGTLNHLLVPAMLDAGRTANRRGIPVLLDPVGVGASSLRRQTVAQLLKDRHPRKRFGNPCDCPIGAGTAQRSQRRCGCASR